MNVQYVGDNFVDLLMGQFFDVHVRKSRVFAEQLQVQNTECTHRV